VFRKSYNVDFGYISLLVVIGIVAAHFVQSCYECGSCTVQIETQYAKCRFNPLQPNDTYRRRTAPLTSKRCILYIYSTNTGTEYFKYGIYSPFFPLQNAVCFIILTYLVPVLLTFYIQDVLKFKK